MRRGVVVAVIILSAILASCAYEGGDDRARIKPTATPGFRIDLPQSIMVGNDGVYIIHRVDTRYIIKDHTPERGVFLILIGSVKSHDSGRVCLKKGDFELRDGGREYQMYREVLSDAKSLYDMDYPGSIFGVCAGGSDGDIEPTYLIFDVPTNSQDLRLFINDRSQRIGQIAEIQRATPIPYLTPTRVPSPTRFPTPTSDPTFTYTPSLTPVPTKTSTRRPSPTPPYYGIVINESVNFRAGPGTDYDIIGQASAGERLEIHGRTSDSAWLKLSTSGRTWVWAPLVRLEDDIASISVHSTQEPTGTPTRLRTSDSLEVEVVSRSINFRSGPGTSYSVLGYLYQGDVLEVIARTSNGNWFNVRTSSREKGWVGANVVSFIDGGSASQIPIAATIPAVPIPVHPPSQPSGGCCKICTTGKACGNTCIRRSYNCHQPPGCACNGY